MVQFVAVRLLLRQKAIPFAPVSKPQIYLFFIAASLVWSCGNKRKVDVSHIPVNVKIERFDRDISALKNGDQAKAAELRKKYGVFYDDYMENILGVGNTQKPAYLSELQRVMSGAPWQDLLQSVDKTFPDLAKQETELTDAFRRIRYYFPQRPLPKVYSFFSGFQVQTPVGNDYIGIGLDLFLGANAKYYPSLLQTFPHYVSRRFTPENITPRVVEAVLREDMFSETDAPALLDKMIYNGKIMYLMDEFLPDTPDSLKIGYTAAQLEWCKNFEGKIWAYYLEENLLYNTDYQKIQKYLTDAPFTPGLGEGNSSAPKLAVWTGWQIVRKYMEKHPDVTPAMLMQLNNAQRILQDAAYKPKP
ncbi:MAG: gliding motility lipoprotein GldB [Mucilaginibacter polytrichastri]|nr:gliding motility lipoprotein GldB [Mucilaginibacter polytrichastri]